ncbi:predicted protein [Histoplasma capsulatum G186AR]|uniref:Uncharacterized protein n=1 Tax=Ajellomyces capsulatus (strain G186AR / H82 / ATCC MYA-2454 / RMSCC 2432) TaxID=447093 RepID=C0NSP2_AJECG|nr:uncharacterized protein HCBG_06172 [Histoplasma capsulatum G186AR]EEH05908.1 predicted protein [Histoplasma capsulatum G186AR]
MAFKDSTKKSEKQKQSPSEIIADIPPLKDVKFNSMKALHRLPAVNLPNNIDPQSPYALFSLYISEADIQNITSSTNAYAEIQISRNPALNP